MAVSLENKLKKDCERLAANHWKLSEKNRVQSYKDWATACDKYACFINDQQRSTHNDQK